DAGGGPYCYVLNWDQTVVGDLTPSDRLTLSPDLRSDYPILTCGPYGEWPRGLWWITGQDVRSTIGFLRPSFGILGPDQGSQGTIYSSRGPSLRPFPTSNALG